MRVDQMDGKRERPPTKTGIGSWKGAVPVGVAAALTLFVAGGLDAVHRHQRAGEDKHEAKPASDAEKTGPRFVVGVASNGTALLVRDLHTGAAVGLPVAPPQGRRFHRVASAKDGSYVVASYGAHRVTFHRLTLGEDGRPEELQDIPKAAVPGASTAWSDLAVSPDGDRIAYVTYKGARSRVDVLSTATGAHKAWTTKIPARVGSLSWSGNMLSFVWSPVQDGAAKHQLRVLDTRLPLGDLKVSKAVMPLPKGSTAAILSRDGKSVIAGAVRNSQMTLQVYTPAGKPAKVLWQQRVRGALTALTPDHTGKALMAAAGDLYTKGAPAVPGQDLADAAW